jgi:hypothetical protein
VHKTEYEIPRSAGARYGWCLVRSAADARWPWQAAASILMPSHHPEGLDRFDKNKTAVKEKMRFPKPPFAIRLWAIYIFMSIVGSTPMLF